MTKSIKNAARGGVSERDCHSSKLLVTAAVISSFSAATAYILSQLLEISPVGTFLLSVSPAAPAAARLLISLSALILSLSMRSALRIGREAWFCSISRGKKPRAARILYWYNPARCLRSVRIVLAIYLIGVAWAIIFLLPGISLLGACIYTVMTRGMEFYPLVSLLSGSLLLLVAGLIFLLVTLQRYFLVFSIIADNPDIKIRTAVKLSKETMNGRCLKVLLFKLSFLPYFALCLFIVPIFFVWPYYNRACIFFKRALLCEAHQ